MLDPELDLAGALRRIDDWQAALETRAAQARDLGARLKDLRVEGEAEHGLVRAAVDHSGRLVDLGLNERVRQWPVRRIAQAVLEAYGAACARATARAGELAAEAGLTEAGLAEAGPTDE